MPVTGVTNAAGSIFAAVLIALVAAYLAIPEFRPWAGTRGGPTTWATTTVVLLAFAAAVRAYRRTPDRSGLRIVLLAAATLMLLQSVRFGADAFGYSLPTLNGVEIGSLADLRDVVSLSAERLGLGFPTGMLLQSSIIGITVALAVKAHRSAADRATLWFVASIGTGAAIPAMGVFGEGTGAWFVTELAGLVSAGFLVIACLGAGDRPTETVGSDSARSPVQ